MKRQDLKTIIKARSFWKIDKRKGNYKLADGKTRLSEYVEKLIETQLEIDDLGIAKNGDCYYYDKEHQILIIPFVENEKTDENEQEVRISHLVDELIF